MTKLNILIVDDDEGDRKQLKRLLKQSSLDYVCTEVSSIVDAKKLCEKSAFDCTIIDYQLPGEDGLVGISSFHVQCPSMAIIMSTGQGDETIAAEAIKCGASDYIVKKSLNINLLEKSIMNAIEKSQLKNKLAEQEAKLEHMAYYDYLTDLPNRLLFDHTLSLILAMAKRNKKKFAVMVLDLDRFKNVNDTLGHEAGDSLLKQVGTRFQSTRRKEDMIARLGGDEFVLLINDTNTAEDASLVAKKIIDCFKGPFLLGTEKINITSSIGIALYPFAGETASDLLKNADKAMYQAKNAGKNTFQFYTPDFTGNVE